MSEAVKSEPIVSETKTPPAVEKAPDPKVEKVPEPAAAKVEPPVVKEEPKSVDGTKEKAPEAVLVPEKYELKLPEGSVLDPAQIEKVSAFAKANKLSNDQAQVVLNQRSEAVFDALEGQKTQLAQQVEAWKAQTLNDKELGGDHIGQSLELAKRVVQRFGSESLKKALDSTGLGNHPELVRTFARIGKQMSEDQLVTPGSGTGDTRKPLEDIFYPPKKSG